MDDKPLRQGITSADYHIPNNIPLLGFYRFVKKIQPTYFQLLGDFIDADAFFGWGKRTSIDVSTKEVLDALDQQEIEFEAANIILDEFDKRLPEGCDKIFHTGNHEVRLIQLGVKAPPLKKQLDFVERLRLKERGYKIISYNSHYAVGYARYVHGLYCLDGHAKKHVQTYMRPIRYGHLHTSQKYTMVSALDGRVFDGECIGCMCNENPEYKKGMPTAWRHGFCYDVVEPTGQFFSHFIPINNGKFYFGVDGNGRPVEYS